MAVKIWFRALIADGNQFLIEKSTEKNQPCVDISFKHNDIKYFHVIPCIDYDIQDDVFHAITKEQCRDMYNENAANLN